MTLFYPRPTHIPPLPPGIRSSRPTPSLSAELLPAPARLAEHPRITPAVLYKLSQEGGSSVAFTSGVGLLHYLFAKPSDVVSVLVHQASSFMKGDQEAAFSAAIGWGLIAEEGAAHRAQQEKFGPAFRSTAMQNYFSAVDSASLNWIERASSGEARPLLASVREFTQESSERSLFLRDTGNVDYRYHEAVFAINELVMGGSRAEENGPEALASIRTYQRHRAIAQEHIRGLVSDWRLGSGNRASLIDYLDLEGIDEEADFGPLHHQVSMFLQASVETTASLISWMLLLLAQNPDYWTHLHEESRIATSSDSIEIESKTMHDAVIDETLRLYPPAWMLPRVAIDDVEIGGVEVSRGARVVLSPWVTHRSPDVFDASEEFRPERWLDPSLRLERGGYFPFGLGTRICIGERYGKMTAKRLLTHLTAAGLHAEVEPLDLSVGSSALITNPNSSVKFALRR